MSAAPDKAWRHGDLAFRAREAAGLRILWVHGYTLDASIWTALWDLLPEFAHLALDLPGHGESARPIPLQARLGDFSAAVAEAADASGADVLLGLSFGATVALQAALERPARYSALLLAACALAGGPQDQSVADCHLALLRLAKERGRGPWLAERWLQSPSPIFDALKHDAVAFAPVAAVVGRHRFDELVHGSMAAMARDLQSVAAVGRLALPVSLLVGEHDMAAFKRSAHLIQKAAPRAHTTYAAQRGHLPLLEAPTEGAAWVRSRLAQPLPN